MKAIVLRFSLLAFLLLMLFQLSKLSLLGQGWNRELFIGIFGLLFIGFGILMARYLFAKPAESAPTSLESPEISGEKIEALGISTREYEVLQCIKDGLSNKEIADQLFISESTVKTHVSNLLLKLDARRRTQAVAKAKEIGIL